MCEHCECHEPVLQRGSKKVVIEKEAIQTMDGEREVKEGS